MNMKNIGSPVEGYAEGEEPLVYHYGKPGERLKNADETVRQFYAEQEAVSKQGIFRTLVRTKTSRFLLVTIVVLSLLIFMLPMITDEKSATVSDIPVQLSAFSFEDSVYVSLKFASKGDVSFESSVPVFAVFKAYSKEEQLVFSGDSQGFYNGEELFLRTSFSDYDIVSVEAVVTVSADTATLRCNVSKN